MKSEMLYEISRWILGILFVFSGLAKSVNPFGFSMQVGEYLSAFGLQALKPLMGLAGVGLPSVEVLLGLMLLLGLSRKIAAWCVLLFMAFFTLLTLWIVIANPVSDCGCFGDVLKISNGATFAKNIVLMFFAIVVFLNRNEGVSRKNVWYAVAVPLSLALAVYSWFNLPLMDATPYKIGVNVANEMSATPGGTQGNDNTVLVYKNSADGTIKEFKLDDEEWQNNEIWEYVDTKTDVIVGDDLPVIRNLPMIDLEGKDWADEILATEGELLIVVTTDYAGLDKIRIDQVSKQFDGRMLVLTSSPLGDRDRIKWRSVEVYNSDHTVISTMIQNDKGGALMLENGVIVKKCVMRNLLRMTK